MTDHTFTEVAETWLRKPGVENYIHEIAYDSGRYRMDEVTHYLKEYVNKWASLEDHTTGMFNELLFQALEKIEYSRLAETFIAEAYSIYGDEETDAYLDAKGI